jgi:hypothetical protein
VRWKLTVRSGPKVQRSSFDEPQKALQALEDRARELATSAPRKAVDTKLKQFEPAQQVFARLELSGPERLVPSFRAGVDVHGDGSVEAYRGRIRRELLKPDKGETAYAALARALQQR